MDHYEKSGLRGVMRKTERYRTAADDLPVNFPNQQASKTTSPKRAAQY